MGIKREKRGCICWKERNSQGKPSMNSWLRWNAIMGAEKTWGPKRTRVECERFRRKSWLLFPINIRKFLSREKINVLRKIQTLYWHLNNSNTPLPPKGMLTVDRPAFSHRTSNQCLTWEYGWKAKNH